MIEEKIMQAFYEGCSTYYATHVAATCQYIMYIKNCLDINLLIFKLQFSLVASSFVMISVNNAFLCDHCPVI